MLNQRAQILQIAAVSIMCLSLAAGVAQGVVEPSDAFPVPGRLYVAEGPTTYSRIEVEILSMSLSGSAADPLYPVGLPGGSYQVDSFFDVFTEISIGGNADTTVARLSGPIRFEIVVPDDPPETTRTIQTEILSMDLSGEVGGIPIHIGVSPSLRSPGETTITDLGGGQWAVDSFFDVFTELSIRGEAPTPADAPTRIVLTPARLGQFEVVVAGDSQRWNDLDESQSGGDGWANPNGQQWFLYPQDKDEPLVDPQGNVEQGPYGAAWWNEWWYNDPYDAERIKIINLSFNYTQTDPKIGNGFVVVAVNWSTTDWSLNPPPGVDPSQQPPLLDFDPANPSVAWVGRMHVLTFPLDDTNPSGTYNSGDIKLPIPYNPEWVSIDVRGYNFTINGGKFIHECVPDPDLPPDIPDITIEQLNWEGLASSTPDSTWGRVTLDHDLSPGIYYFNLSIGGAAAPMWVVHNLSIESLGGPQPLMAYLDLGVQDGTDVSSLDYGYTITNVPLTGPPPIMATTSVPDLDFQIGGEGGVDLGSPSAPKTNTSNSVVDSANSGTIPDKDKFVNQPQGKNQCAPGAISNSLKYLQARGKISSTLPTSINDVGTVVGTTATGTPSSWYLKKKAHYKKHVTTRFIEAPLTVAKVKELAKELKDGQDIEMDLKGHVEVLAGIRLKADGTVDLDLYDDNQTDKKSDPMHTSPVMVDASGTQYVDGMELERFVIECPVEKPTICLSSFSLNTFMDWSIGLEGHECGHIIPMDPGEWEIYWGLWQNQEFIEDPTAPYPQTEFQTPQLYVYEGDGDPQDPEGQPNDAGLVMAWGNPDLAPGTLSDQASAWKYKYGVDPDLSNSIITVVVTAPQFGFGGGSGQVNQVSLGLETPPANNGLIRSWYWNCGPVGSGAPIEWGVPTTIKIDTSMTGTAAATPTATNYLNVPGFDITNVQWIIVDENGTWVGGSTPAPGPGGTPVFMWNYWHWLMVSPKTTLSKGYFTKWSQGPIVLDTGDPPLFWGWDEPSDYYQGPVVADDWLCEDDRPISDFHWWGSFPGWKEPYPPCQPKAFHLGIWTDAPAIAGDPESYSHPDELVWSHVCDNYVWNFAGYDRDPRQFDPHGDRGGGIPGDDPTFEPTDSCFQYNQLLSQEDWFYQDTEGEPNRIYWLSIAPIWDYDCNYQGLNYQWGWKTRPHFFEDNAVSIQRVLTTNADGTVTFTWPPVLGSKWATGVPLQIPPYTGPGSHRDAISWDVAFELTTIEPSYEDDPIPGDIDLSGDVGFGDLVIMAANWGRLIAP